MGEKPKMGVTFAKFLLLSKIQTLSHKLLVRQTSYHHNCKWHAKKPRCWDFQVILSSSSWSKQLCLCSFKEQIWLPNRKCYGKNKLFDQEEMLKNGSFLQIYGFFRHANSNGTGFKAVHLNVSELWLYVCIILETTHQRTTFGIF